MIFFISRVFSSFIACICRLDEEDAKDSLEELLDFTVLFKFFLDFVSSLSL